MKTYLRILGIARSNIKYLPMFIISTLLYSIFTVTSAAIFIPVLNLIFDPEKEYLVRNHTELPEFTMSLEYPKDVFYFYFEDYLVDDKYAALVFVCTLLICSVFLSNLFRYANGVILAKVRAKIIARVRDSIFDSIITLPLSYFSDARKGDVISRTMTDVQLIESTVVGSMKVFFKEPFLIIAYLIMLFNISIELTLFTLVLFPLSGLIIGGIVKKLKRKAILSQESLGRIANILDETLSGMRIVKAFTANKIVSDRYHKETNHYAKLSISISQRFELGGPISELLGYGVIVIVLLIGGDIILDGKNGLAGSEFIVFIAVYAQLLSPAKAITGSMGSIQRGIAAGDRVFEILDATPEIRSYTETIKISDLAKSLEMKNLNFSYEEEAVLKNINISIEKGNTIALVGPSGSGKSTLADLIPRFYDVEDGEIIIDGIDIKAYDIDSLRSIMGIVTQESILFNDSIINNIAFGQPEATYEQIIEAAKIANAHDFILAMEQGYDTNVGERGAKLSGGQRQRLSIARAVLKNPPILILDEATSALDSESEKLVQEAIDNLMRNRTSVVIAHRLSTIQRADEIIVLQNGEIVQRGKHHELLALDGMYKKLIEMQSF